MLESPVQQSDLSHGDWSESLGGAAEPPALVSAAVMDLGLVFIFFPAYSLNLFLCVQNTIFPPKYCPHGNLTGCGHPGMPRSQSVLCHLPAGPHIIFPAVLIDFGADLPCSR